MPTINNKTQFPLALNYPYAINYTISVVLPGGWNVEKSYNDVKRDAYFFSSKIEAIKDTLLLNYRFKYLQDFIPVNKLNEYRADAKSIKMNDLSYTFTYTPTDSGIPFHLNYWMLFSVAVFVLALGAISLKIYRIETPEILFEAGANFKPLGGWLIFIAFGLGISTIVILVNLCTGTYFDLNKWNAYANTRMENGFKTLFTYEALGNVFLMCYALFCLVLLLNRRDILPKFIIGLYLCSLCFFVGDYAIAWLVNHGQVSERAGSNILRAVIASAIWIPYFLRSTRVEQTFIVPYPPTNFRFEEVEPEKNV